MTEQQLRDEMVQIGASLFSRGYATGSAGNLSLLLPDGNLLATPTGSSCCTKWRTAATSSAPTRCSGRTASMIASSGSSR